MYCIVFVAVVNLGSGQLLLLRLVCVVQLHLPSNCLAWRSIIGITVLHNCPHVWSWITFCAEVCCSGKAAFWTACTGVLLKSIQLRPSSLRQLTFECACWMVSMRHYQVLVMYLS